MPRNQTYKRGASGELIPNYGNPPLAASGKAERAWPCYVCGIPFRESELRWFRGEPYGIPCGDHEDIRGILLSERARQQEPPAGAINEKPAEIIIEN